MQLYVKVMRSSDGEEKFFGKIGRFFASPSVREEVGAPLDDGPDRVWLAALEKRTFRAVGLIGLCEIPDVTEIAVIYVEPQYRGKQVFATLLDKAMHFANIHRRTALRADIPRALLPAFRERGFSVLGEGCSDALVRVEKTDRG